MQNNSMSIKILIDNAKKNKIVLPNFQRSFKWNNLEDQSKLVASILTNIPIGSALLVNSRGDNSLFSFRHFAQEKESEEIVSGDIFYLLDGQQRYTTLLTVFDNIFSIYSKNKKNIVEGARNLWFIRFQRPNDKNIESSILGYKYLDSEEIENIKTLVPDDLEDFIHFEKIDINDQNPAPFHPLYNSEYRDTELVNYCVDRFLLPLFEPTLFSQILPMIAKKRSEYLLKTDEQYFKNIQNNLSLNSTKEELRIQENNRNWVNGVISFYHDLVNSSSLNYLELDSSDIERAAVIFETMNKGGIALTNFELISSKVSRYLPNKKSYSDFLLEFMNEDIEIPTSFQTSYSNKPWKLSNTEVFKKNNLNTYNNLLLNLITLLHQEKTKDIFEPTPTWIKQTELLRIKPEEIRDYSRKAVIGLNRALMFLNICFAKQKVSDINYKLSVIPIAFFLCDDENFHDIEIIKKLKYWYLGVMFTDMYLTRQNEATTNSLGKLYRWIKFNECEFNFEDNILDNKAYNNFQKLSYGYRYNEIDKKFEPVEEGIVKSVPKALEMAIIEYCLSKKPQDFRKDVYKLSTYENDDKLEKHHIIPLQSCNTIGESNKKLREEKTKALFHSPLNLAYITAKANRDISNKKPEEYFMQIHNDALLDHYLSEQSVNNCNNIQDYAKALYSRYLGLINAIKKDLAIYKN